MDGSKIGRIVWTDLTVPGDAAEVASFYEKVCGWRRGEVPMGDYSDYSMHAGDPTKQETCVGGVCHACGSNAKMPPVWMVYVQVEDAAAAARAAEENGGAIVDGPRPMGGHTFAVVRDPAGAHFGLISGGS